MSADHVVWVVPCPAWVPVPLLAFSPEHRIGAAPRGKNIPGVFWMEVSEDGVPTGASAATPKFGTPHADMILFRLAQAYSAIALASDKALSPLWKA